MKKIWIVGLGFIVAAGLAPVSAYAEGSSPELLQKGEELFTKPSGALGNKFACILCHKNEKALKRAHILKLGDSLPNAINDNLVKRAKGKALAVDSEEMKALAAYITEKHAV